MTTAASTPYVGVFDLFSIGLGPSSSHTVGPMRAAADFAARLGAQPRGTVALEVTLYGSLAATGAGHGTFSAVLVGLEGCRPETVGADEVRRRIARIERDGGPVVPGCGPVALTTADIVREPFTVLERHSNGMRFVARDADGDIVASDLCFSIGGGFVVHEGEAPTETAEDPVPVPFASAQELLASCAKESATIAELVHRNECARRDEAGVRAGVLAIRDAMRDCVTAGIAAEGVLPGGLGVRRRAPGWHRELAARDPDRDPRYWQDWVNLVALAVNEENAAGGRVVTAPTNGAAGIIPAVLHYAERYAETRSAGLADDDDIAVEFLLTATAIGSLYKSRASISGAEVGCQGEVGSASSMAAGALAAVLGGTPAQIENAAEIAMEHSLGMTCDPVGGLVQIPCIERNAIAAGRAINAATMALRGDGAHLVSLDAVIETMRQTGRDMSHKYKETALGGLAVNMVEC